jgi:mono/diheme cytochrome c family protein
MPPMPVPALKNLTDEDVKAIYSYLKTIKPVKNLVPQAQLNPPPPPAAN